MSKRAGQRRAADCSAEHSRARRFWGHPVFIAVVSPSAVGAVTVLLCIPISTATILVDVASCVVSPLIIDGVVEDKCCPLRSRRRLLVDRYLLFVLGRLITLLRACSSTSRGRALGLLNRRHLEQSLHLISNSLCLGVGRFRHVS